MQSDKELRLDVLRGVPAIAAFVCLNERQTYHALQNGHIPAIKEGATWVTTKSRLRRHYNGDDDEGAQGEKDSAGLMNDDLAAVAPSKRGSGTTARRRPIKKRAGREQRATKTRPARPVALQAHDELAGE